jgi:peptidoglycan/xylan/chitin deacetylase (PgdA/CDA1 family)
MKKKNHTILLTFDVEEFDHPLENGASLPSGEQMNVGKGGLDRVSELLDDTGINCTLFTTANFALKYPSAIADLSTKHEIASHSFFHSSFNKKDLSNSRQVLENIISKKVLGLRMPGMKKIEAGLISAAGYTYDSSVIPTWLSGRDNPFRLLRTCYNENGITRIPLSVSANFRIPLYWLAFKNFPYSYYKKLALQSLNKDGYLSLYFHPWEFLDLGKYDLPLLVKRKSGTGLIEKLKRLITDLKQVAEFKTIQSFLENRNERAYVLPRQDSSFQLRQAGEAIPKLQTNSIE